MVTRPVFSPAVGVSRLVTVGQAKALGLAIPSTGADEKDAPDSDHATRRTRPHERRRFSPAEVTALAAQLRPWRNEEEEEKFPIRVESAWLEVPLGETGWRAAFRLLLRAGHHVIAELRIFPYEDFPGRIAGQWSAELLGDKATCPGEGITARVLRSVRMRTHFGREFPKVLAWHKEHTPGFEDYLRDLGFTSLAPQPRRRRGRRGRPDLFYARLARAYVARVRAESEKPVRDLAADAALARRLGLSPRDLTPALVQDALNTARERNLLTRPPRPAYAGGELTPRALAVLKQAPGPLPSKHSASTKRKR